MSKVLPLVQFFNVEDLSREVVSSFTNTVSENINTGINKITELRAILQRESQNSLLYKQTNQSTTGNCENRNDPDLIQAFISQALCPPFKSSTLTPIKVKK